MKSSTGSAGSSPPPDHYATLGLPRYAAPADVSRAYRQKAATSHPDRNPNVPADAFVSITQAYEILSNEATRAQYDVTLRRGVLELADADTDDSLSAIERDRLKAKTQPRVPLSSYAPGADVMRHMREMVTNDVEDTRKASDPLFGAASRDVRLQVTESAVEETLRVRKETDTERVRMLNELEKLHLDAESDRERRRRERDERRGGLSPRSKGLPATVVAPVLRCEQSDRADLWEEESAAWKEHIVVPLSRWPGIWVPADETLDRLPTPEVEALVEVLRHKLECATAMLRRGSS